MLSETLSPTASIWRFASASRRQAHSSPVSLSRREFSLSPRQAISLQMASPIIRARSSVTHASTSMTPPADVRAMVGACEAGAGIAQIMQLGARHLIESGALVELFPDWPDELFGLYVLYPSR